MTVLRAWLGSLDCTLISEHFQSLHSLTRIQTQRMAFGNSEQDASSFLKIIYIHHILLIQGVPKQWVEEIHKRIKRYKKEKKKKH